MPMEIIERELYGNLLLCSKAIENGWQCILGTKASIISAAPHLPHGVAFLKSIVTSDMQNIRPIKNAGHKIVSLDVEGLVYTNVQEFVDCRFCKETMREAEKIFFWGSTQRNAVASNYPEDQGKLFVTGTPITDLWLKPKYHLLHQQKVNEIHNQYGSYILIPSSFGTANHFMGHKANKGIIERDKLVGGGNVEEFMQFWDAYEDHLVKIFHKFLDFLPKLAKAFPDKTIIIRPHPSEAHKTWIEAAKGLSNVEVVFEGAVSPWLLGADAILHYGCTTGLEGYLMGKPVVAYNPSSAEEKEKFDHPLPHCISVIATTEEDTLAKLEKVMSAPDSKTVEDEYPSIRNGRKLLETWIYETENGAANEIMQHLNTMDLPQSSLGEIPVQKRPAKEAVWDLIAFLTKPGLLRKLLPSRIKIGIESRAYGKHKTRTIDEAYLKQAIDCLTEIEGTGKIEARKLSENLYFLGGVES